MAYRVGARWSPGGRAAMMSVRRDDESPTLVSIEPFVELLPAASVRICASVLVPVADLSNDDVPPGLGGYDPPENTSIGLSAIVTIDR